MVKKTDTIDTKVLADSAAVEPDQAIREISQDDAATLHAANNAVLSAQQILGRTLEQFKLDEQACLQTITENRNSLSGVLETLARKHDVDLRTGKWVFEFDKMRFAPRK